MDEHLALALGDAEHELDRLVEIGRVGEEEVRTHGRPKQLDGLLRLGEVALLLLDIVAWYVASGLGQVYVGSPQRLSTTSVLGGSRPPCERLSFQRAQVPPA